MEKFSIIECIVLEPPTSDGVRERALQALRSGSGFLSLILLPLQEVPEPKPVQVEFRIAQTIHPQEGEMTISGLTQDNRSVSVRVLDRSQEPAQASLVM